MLNQILESFKGESLQELTSKLGLTEKEANDSIDIVGEEIESTVTSEVKRGNLSGLVGMFGDKDGDGVPDILENLGGGVVSSLTSKLGFSSEKSQLITNTILPIAIKFFSSKFSGVQEKSGIGLEEIFSTIAGGNNDESAKGGGLLGGVLGKLGGIFNK